MNAAQAESALNGMTAIARKVYEATPAQEAWQVHAIRSEVVRMHGTAPAMNITEGCLNTLIGAGLVKEVGTRTYMRTAVRPRMQAVKATAPGSDTGGKPAAEHPAAGAVDRGEVAANQEFEGVKVKPASVEPIVAIDLLSREVRSVADDFHVLAQTVQAAQLRLARISEALDDVALGVTDSMEKFKAEAEQFRQLKAILKNVA